MLLVSPMLSCEDAYLLGHTLRSFDPAAVLGVGPIPMRGQDKTIPGEYTIFAEKCPNSRGVRKALELVAGSTASASSPHADSSGNAPEVSAPGHVFSYAECLSMLADAHSKCGSLVVTGNYPDPWMSDELQRAFDDKFVVAIDALSNGVTAKADVALPATPWAEKSGTFLSARNHLQHFERAILPFREARSEGQIAGDLLAALEHQSAASFDAVAVRRQMGGIFVSDVRYADERRPTGSVMQFTEL